MYVIKSTSLVGCDFAEPYREAFSKNKFCSFFFAFKFCFVCLSNPSFSVSLWKIAILAFTLRLRSYTKKVTLIVADDFCGGKLEI